LVVAPAVKINGKFYNKQCGVLYDFFVTLWVTIRMFYLSVQDSNGGYMMKPNQCPMRLLHTMLRVGDLEKSIAFYTQLLV
jgi:hypothetical protein